jgi:hypothetical protein
LGLRLRLRARVGPCAPELDGTIGVLAAEAAPIGPQPQPRRAVAALGCKWAEERHVRRLPRHAALAAARGAAAAGILGRRRLRLRPRRVDHAGLLETPREHLARGAAREEPLGIGGHAPQLAWLGLGLGLGLG